VNTIITRTRLLVALSAAGLALSACGSDVTATPVAATVAPAVTAAPATASPTTAPAAAPTAGASVVVKAASSTYGQILVDDGGNTLYAFLNDTDAKSTCTGTCAEAWPPAIVDASWSVAPGLDAGVFSTVVRPEGAGEQLTAGRFPLYRFSGDARPGDVTGQGSGGVWFVVGTDAAPIQQDTSATDATDGKPPVTEAVAPETTPAPVVTPVVATASNPLGTILVDQAGLTLYAFVPDGDAGKPSCLDACAQAWPPLIVTDAPELGDLAASGVFSVVPRPDGTLQLQAGKWPLYHFAGDAAPGDANGQGSGGKWFVVGPDGKLIK
jgi:predicted lipoprotein with Yx(FWY)xxD motif